MIQHASSRCPVHRDTIVRVRFASGHISREAPAWHWIWKKRGWDHDVDAFEIIREAEQ